MSLQKNFIKKVVNYSIAYNSKFKQITAINKRLSIVKQRGDYKKFPINDETPEIRFYPKFKASDMKWLDFYYSVNQNPDSKYISGPIYNHIESVLNDRLLTYGIKEKNFYDSFINGIFTPNTLVRKIFGHYYDSNYNLLDSEKVINTVNLLNKIVIKPSVVSGGGSSIFLFEKIEGVMQSKNTKFDQGFLKNYNKDFVLQEFIEQHQFFKQFNPTSNNTIRVFLYRSVTNDKIHILHTLLRVGGKDNFIDHDQYGGTVINICPENTLGDHAIDINGKKFKIINNINLDKIHEVPSMEDVRKMAINIARQIYYARIIALDFSVDRELKPLLLEVNCWRNGINQYQMHNGSLFKEYSAEIFDYCKEKEMKYTILF